MGVFEKFKGVFGGAADYYARHFGLHPDEHVLQMWIGYFVPDVSTTKRAVIGAVGALFGTIAAVRGQQVNVALTNRGRVAFGQVEDGGQPVQYGHPRPRVDVLGDGKGSLSGPRGMEPSKILRFTLADGRAFRVQLCTSAANTLSAWSVGY